MKIRILIACLLFAFTTGFSQAEKSKILVDGNSYRQAGFVMGSRLDSLPLRYIVLETSQFYANKKIDVYSLDIGQDKAVTGDKIQNRAGNSLIFQSITVLLNFFDFNGWSLKEVDTETASWRTQKLIFEKLK